MTYSISNKQYSLNKITQSVNVCLYTSYLLNDLQEHRAFTCYIQYLPTWHITKAQLEYPNQLNWQVLWPWIAPKMSITDSIRVDPV